MSFSRKHMYFRVMRLSTKVTIIRCATSQSVLKRGVLNAKKLMPTEDHVLVSQDARRQELQFDTTRCSSFLEELIFIQLQVSNVLASLEDYWKETLEPTRVSSFLIH
jgi:hypothetical protein